VVLLEEYRDLRKHYSERYRYILVDEYQDTNRPQYELLRLLSFSHRNLFVVGDEDQSIYKFRGADIRNILTFEKDFPGARIIKLEQNYRSSRNILRVAGSVVSHNTERKGKVLWTQNAGGDIVTCFQAESAREEASWVVERIREILDGDPDCRVAVLYRANFLSRSFEDVLIEEGIPYAIVGSVAFFGRMEVKDLLAYLRVIFNPEDDLALLRIINTPPRGIGSATLEAVTKEALERGIPILETAREKARDPGLPGRASKALLHFLELLDKWTALQKTASIAKMIETILEDTRYADMLRKQETEAEAENRLANIEELVRAAAESEARGETVSDFLDRAALSSELDQLDPDARVSLMTLHSAKGLEFDTVFLVAMEEGIFPHSQSMESEQELEEERRLCYVGITRAKRKLYLSWALYRKKYGPDAGFPAEVSRFLNEMPRDLMEGFEDEEPYSASRRSHRRDRFYEPEEDYVAASPRRHGRAETRPQPKSIAELRAYMERMQRDAAPGVRDGKEAPLLKPGMRVYHEQFGDGIILQRERMGGEIKLTVTFSRAGRKSLIERYAKLRPL
jgi:DNA helicase-2/ATP-dependent DNA helicase PcrA